MRKPTLPGEHCDGDSWVAQLDEGPSLVNIQAVPGQQDVLGTNKAVHQLFILLQTHIPMVDD